MTTLVVRRALAIGIGVCALATVVGLVLWWPSGSGPPTDAALAFGEVHDAEVRSVDVEPCSYDESVFCDQVTIDVANGDEASFEFAIDSGTVTLRPGDDIVVSDAPDAPPELRYQFQDFQRRTPLVLLAVLFAVAVVALGRWRGLLALAGLVITFAVLVGFVLPALLRGSSPVGVALTGASVIAFVALYVTHGFGERSTVALIGTLASLGITAALGAVFGSAADLTGLASEESRFLLVGVPTLDFRGLLLAAVIIGALGVLDDVTVTQTSAVWELHRANPSMPARSLYAAGLRIGRDHIASTVNTLVLAYAAAALPLLLVYTQSALSLGRVAQTETLAVEIVQTLVGSIGLVASVPITTALAAFVVTRRGD